MIANWINRILILLLSGLSVFGQDWPVYGGDAGGTRYSSLKQINRTNVSKLKTAWTFRTGDVSDGTEYPVRSAFEATPLMIDGVLYVVTVFDRLIALEAETGKELWAFDPKLDKPDRKCCSPAAEPHSGLTASKNDSSTAR